MSGSKREIPKGVEAMDSKITVRTVKAEIKKAELDPKDFFIYNDGVTVNVSAEGIDITLQETSKMHSDAAFAQTVIARMDGAQKKAQGLWEALNGKFDCSKYIVGARLAGMSITR